jgi:hypothetical protein
MTSLELAVLQGALILLLAPVCAGIGNTLVTLVRQKSWVMPWVMYRRENGVVASVALGATLFLGILLPLLGTDGYSGVHGNVVSLLALMVVIGGVSALLDAKSIVPKAMCVFGAALLALGLTAGSMSSSGIMLAASASKHWSIALVAIVMVLVLIALRNDAASERTRDVRVVLRVVLGLYLVNILSMMTMTILFADEQPVVNVLIGAGKAIGVALVIECLAAVARRSHRHAPEQLIRIALALSVFAIIAAVWLSNPTV